MWRRDNAAGGPAPGVDFGWKVHSALQEWTKSVDQKASIILVFTTALATLAGTEVFSSDGGLYASEGAKLWAIRAMAAAFATSALLALSVVLPTLRRSAAKREALGGLVYFGHLRHRSIDDIERGLRALDDAAAMKQLARQLHATSAIAWRKHARLQAAVFILVLACAWFAVARLLL